MKKVWATLQTFGVLVGLWVILAVVGILTGAVPIEGLRPQVSLGDEPDEEADADAGVDSIAEAEADAGTEVAAQAVDSGIEEAPTLAQPVDGPEAETEGTDATEAERWAVCPSTDAEPSLAIADVFGDARPEIVVGCPNGWHVLGLTSRGPQRIAVFSIAPSPAEQRARVGRAAFGDVDGDATVDLVLPLAFESAAGATRGGGLWWVPRDGFGGIREPVALAPIAAVDVAIAPLDGSAGAEIVAMNRTNALAQLPSEAWVFGGGPAPARSAALVLGLGGAMVQLGDLDRDGQADVVALSRGRIDLHFGDGTGFPRSHRFDLAGAREIALGDVDGDGGGDLVVLGEGVRWIRAGSLEGMEPRGVDGVPATLRGLQVLDVNGDGKVDLTGWDHPRLVVLEHTGEVDFVPRDALTLSGGPFGPRRHRIVDLDHDDQADDVALLGTTSGEGAQLELVLVTDALDGAAIAPAGEARDVPNAPLVLRAHLH
ncbi:MAG: hypothetical protein SangKO_002980 [Sandaracinaceae bacterium]